MALIEAKGRPHVICEKCKTTLVLPSSLSPKLRRKAASLRRTEKSVEAIDILNKEGGLDLREAKALVLHIPQDPGICNKCGAALEPSTEVCPKCRSINLNWG